MMINTIKLHTNNKEALQQRIKLNTGVKSVVQPNVGRQYENHTFVPKDNWYQPSQDELDALISDNPLFNGNKIRVLELPQSLISLIDHSGIGHLKNKNEQKLAFQQKRSEIKSLFTGLMSFSNALMIDSTTQKHLGFLSAPMGQQTTAVNGLTQLYAGLHIDSYDQKLLSDAENSRQRMTIHLGKEKRYLLFINLTIAQLCEKLSKVGVTIDDSYGQTKLVYEFFKYYPDTSMIQLEQHPYEAYIAPTENMIHDGRTPVSDFLDLTWTTVGDFGNVDFNAQL